MNLCVWMFDLQYEHEGHLNLYSCLRKLSGIANYPNWVQKRGRSGWLAAKTEHRSQFATAVCQGRSFFGRPLGTILTPVQIFLLIEICE